MKTEEHLDDLMVQWGTARAAGQALTAEDLCQGNPELVQPLRERLTILEAMSWLDDINKHQPGEDTLPEPASFLSELRRQDEIPELTMTPEALCQKLMAAGVLTAEESLTALREAGGDEPLICHELAAGLMHHGKLTAFQLRRVVENRGDELAMGGYLLVDEIGAGGMGRVYRAHHRRMKRIVALKVLAAEVVNELALQRFHREVEAVARLDHPNIVTAHDAAEAGGRHFLVMQYIDGEDLAHLVARRGPLSPGQALNCVVQAARGLEYAHKMGIVHRDIKPSNLMIDRSETVKILDMGLAKLSKKFHIAAGSIAGAEASLDLTEEQVVMGTADYMAPEQALDTHHANQKSDVYSLGATLHFLLTGQPMFTGATLMARMIAHREQPIPSLRERNPTVPDWLEAIFRKMVAKNPDERYPSMTALLNDLGAHAEQTEKVQLETESRVFLKPGPLVDTSSIACRNTLCEEKPVVPTARPNAGRFQFFAAVAVTFVLVAFGLWASGALQVRTPDGTIVVELEGKPIPVQVNEDGTITITDPGDSKKIEVKVEKGKKLLTLTKAGFQALALEFNLSTKDGRRLTARFVPNPPVSAEPKLKFGREFGNHGDGYWLNRLVLAPKQDRVVISGGGIYCYDLKEGKRLWTIVEREKPGRGLVLCPDGEHFLVAHFDDPRIIKGRVSDGHVVETWPAAAKGMATLALSPEGDAVAASDRDGPIQIWDLKSGKPVRKLENPDNGCMVTLVYSPDGRYVLGGRDDRFGIDNSGPSDVLLWDANTGKLVKRFEGHDNSVLDLAFLTGGKEFLSCSRDGTVRRWELATGKQVYAVPHLGSLHALVLCPGGNYFLSGAFIGKLRLHETATGRVVDTLEPQQHNPLHLAILPDEKHAIATTSDGRVVVVELPPKVAPK